MESLKKNNGNSVYALYVPIGDHVNFYQWCWQTKYLGVLATSHVLYVISLGYCWVFVKSYNFIFDKIDIEYAPHHKWQTHRRFCIYMQHVSFSHWRAQMLSTSHMKYTFLHTTSVLCQWRSPESTFYGVKIAQRAYRKNITVYLYAMVPEGQYYTMRQEGTNKYKGYDRKNTCAADDDVWTVVSSDDKGGGEAEIEAEMRMLSFFSWQRHLDTDILECVPSVLLVATPRGTSAIGCRTMIRKNKISLDGCTRSRDQECWGAIGPLLFIVVMDLICRKVTMKDNTIKAGCTSRKQGVGRNTGFEGGLHQHRVRVS